MVIDGFCRRYGGQHHQLGGGAGAVQRQRFRSRHDGCDREIPRRYRRRDRHHRDQHVLRRFELPGIRHAGHLNSQMIAFTPHATNGISGSPGIGLNVDSLGTKPLRLSPGVECQPGTVIQGTPYVAVYNNSDGVFYLQGFYGNPYNVPLGAGLDYWGPTAQNSSFAFPSGPAQISRTTYAPLFSMIGTTYGTGGGSTTFNLPDKRGRVSAATDDMGGSSAFRLTTGFFSATAHLGATGGSESHTLTVAEIPAHTHPSSLSDPGHVHSENIPEVGGGSAWNNCNGAGNTAATFVGPNTSSAVTGITINNASQGGGSAHVVVQPTIVCNYIMRII
jgi:microcystin-dependent protein